MSRKMIALFLVLLLAISISVQALALAQKDEVVYARLNQKGQVEETIIINAFEANEQTEVVDYGAYAQAQVLGQAEGFAYQDKEATFTMQPGRFSYQGTPENQQLPWNIEISYNLDGQAVEAEALSGASGQLEGRIKITINEAMKAYAASQTLQVTLTLDGDRAYDIQAENATLAIAGGKRTISFVILPGQEADYVFSARVQDFAMEAIQFAGIRMGMDMQMYQNATLAALAGSPLEGAISGLMGNILSGMQGQEAQSFTDARNSVRSLQFVLFTKGIPQKAVEAAPVEVAEDLSLWQRLLSLVGL